MRMMADEKMGHGQGFRVVQAHEDLVMNLLRCLVIAVEYVDPLPSNLVEGLHVLLVYALHLIDWF